MNNSLYGWGHAPEEIACNYVKKCKLFSEIDEEFNKFRQDADYTKILEGKSREIGDINLDKILRTYPNEINTIINNLEKFKENDIYGSPTIINYKIVGDIAPATIKYIGNVLDIKSIVGNKKLNKIVEIGGGFGALCKTISVLYNFEEYILVDLPDVISLCKKYLNNFDDIKNKITYITTDDFNNIENIKDVDLFIADSSLSECDDAVQHEYVDKILINSKFAYMVYNTLHIQEAKNTFNRIYEKINQFFNIRTEKYGDVLLMFLENIKNKDDNKNNNFS